MEEKPIIFEDWEQALMTTVSPDLRRAYREAIVKFRYWTYEMNDVPSAGARDLGGPPWERALVSRIREKNLAWTTEKTYRAWCRRFAVRSRRCEEEDNAVGKVFAKSRAEFA